MRLLKIKKLNQTQYAIIRQLVVAVEKLGGDIQILAAIGSWGDTLPEEEVLALLEDWNNARNRNK